jgi:hypothetical protein
MLSVCLVESFSMPKIILLDTGILGMVVHPNSRVNFDPIQWLETQLESGNCVLVPEIADYELRRSLIRLNSQNSIQELDNLGAAIGYLALNTAVMLLAARLWAEARLKGYATAGDAELDGDVILAAQARMLASRYTSDEVIVATTNIGHLARFVQAEIWQNITV